MKRSLKTTGVVAGRGGGQPVSSGNGVEAGLWAMIAAVLVTILISIGPALSAAGVAIEGFSIVIPIDELELEDEGSITVLATVPVGAEFAGQTCTVTSVAENQESIHPGNNLTVASGGSVVVLEDVESGANVIVVADGELILGSEIVISLVMGPDGVFSAGLDVHVDCEAVVVTTTTLEATTTTLEATTTTGGQSDSTSSTLPSETTSTVGDTVRGTVLTTTTVADEVEDVVVLPFTGPSNGELLFLSGGAMTLVGIILVASRREDSE